MRPRPIACFLVFLLLCVAMPVLPQSPGLTIDQAYDLARKSSEAIRLKELALQKSRLAVTEAGSRALPGLDLQASGSYLTNPPQGYTVSAGELGSITPVIPPHSLGPTQTYPIPLGTFTIPPTDFTIGSQLHNYFSLTASLSQPLFTWGKIKNAIDLATLQVDAVGNDLTAQQLDIDREVHRAYYGALLAQESQIVLEKLRDTAAQIVADRQKSLDQGTANKEAVLEARSDLAVIQTKLAQAGQSKATAFESLGMLTGLDPSSIALAGDFRSALPALDEPALRTKALQSSTALVAARTVLSQARKKLAIEQGSAMLLPDFSLGVTLDVTGQEDVPYADWSWNASQWSWDLIISLGMKMSVFDGLSSFSRVGQAEKDLEMAGTALSQQEKLVRLSVRKAVDAAVGADADAAEKQAKADLAAERLKNAQSSYDNGLASRDDLNGADILAGSAQLDLLLSRYNREEALADLSRIIGERL